MADILGGYLVGKALKRQGVECVFMLCGGHITPIYLGCHEEGIRLIDVRHEQTAGYAADAWARVTKKPGVALVTAGPGVTNAVTAIANDVAYDQVFRKQLEYFLRDGDAVLLVSASGNSPNVVEACRYAKKRGVPTLAFVGFDGGELKRIVDHAIHVDVDNYGITEDVHQGLMHILSQYVARTRRS